MVYFVFTLLLLFLLFLGWRHHRLIRLLAEVLRSVETKRAYLLNRPFGIFGRHPVDGLCLKIQELLETEARYAELESNTLAQLESALENLREAVITVSPDKTIVMANRSARILLAAGKPIQGRRLEQIFRSTELIEYLDELNTDPLPDQRELMINRGMHPLWIEVSASPVRILGEISQEMTILVLKDVTRIRELDRVRKDFLANVSHELKTPLTVIKGFSETLADEHETMEPAYKKRFFRKILSNVERLNRLIQDLLTLSRLETGPDKLDRQPHHLPLLVNEVIENFESRLTPGKQSIKLETKSEVEPVLIDPLRITQVIENLIENAFRYALGFTCITVSLKTSDDGKDIVCTVADDGMGIPAKDLPHIFDRFYRVDKGRSRERGGTGLGLSIVKHIIHLHGGDIHAESEPGKGTKMVFSLPVASASVESAKPGIRGAR